ncbi:MAG: glycosyltransferase family 4 protein [Actinomycetota bacterium]|nr:glycosyltransferase family 4 protein [Actinomycetota bacterium]
MKVAYVLFDPGIAVGGVKGASVHVARFCQSATKLGHEVHLFVTSVVDASAVDATVHHIYLDKVKSNDASKIEASNKFAEALETELRAGGFDLIYERLSLFFGAGSRIADELGIRRILEINAPIARERANHFLLVEHARATADERAAISGADVVCVTSALIPYAASNGASRVRVVPNGVSIDDFDLPRRPNATFTIGFVGSLKGWHGVDNLLLAAELLHERKRSFLLRIVGEGPRGEHLRQLALSLSCSSKIEFVGAIPMSEIPREIASFDVGVAPYVRSSDFYFSPLKVLEYMAGGAPVIATDTPSIRSITADCAILVTDPGPIAISSAIEAIMDSPFLGCELSNKARKRVIEKFSWDDTVAEILEADSLVGDLSAAIG